MGFCIEKKGISCRILKEYNFVVVHQNRKAEPEAIVNVEIVQELAMVEQVEQEQEI